MEYTQFKVMDNLLSLGLQERIYIVEKLWQSILNEMKLDTKEISTDEIAKIDRRLEKLERGESKLYTWQEVRQSISKRK